MSTITVKAVLDNLIATVEGTTPASHHDGVTRFTHVRDVLDADDLVDDQCPTRLFVVLPTGRRNVSGVALAYTEPFEVETELEVTVLYRQGSDTKALLGAIMEDVDSLTYRLMDVRLYAQATTGILLRRCEDYRLQFGAGEAGVARLTLPVTIRYRPSFAL